MNSMWDTGCGSEEWSTGCNLLILHSAESFFVVRYSFFVYVGALKLIKAPLFNRIFQLKWTFVLISFARLAQKSNFYLEFLSPLRGGFPLVKPEHWRIGAHMRLTDETYRVNLTLSDS